MAERLNCFVYKKEFTTRHEELKNVRIHVYHPCLLTRVKFLRPDMTVATGEQEIKEVNIAMHEVRTSNKLRRVMEVILVLVNFMNRAYGYYGQAQGYTTESLIKVLLVFLVAHLNCTCSAREAKLLSIS